MSSATISRMLGRSAGALLLLLAGDESDWQPAAARPVPASAVLRRKRRRSMVWLAGLGLTGLAVGWLTVSGCHTESNS
jgi:hypothetical protein